MMYGKKLKFKGEREREKVKESVEEKENVHKLAPKTVEYTNVNSPALVC